MEVQHRCTDSKLEMKIGDYIMPRVTIYKYFRLIIKNDEDIGDVYHMV